VPYGSPDRSGVEHTVERCVTAVLGWPAATRILRPRLAARRRGVCGRIRQGGRVGEHRDRQRIEATRFGKEHAESSGATPAGADAQARSEEVTYTAASFDALMVRPFSRRAWGGASRLVPTWTRTDDRVRGTEGPSFTVLRGYCYLPLYITFGNFLLARACAGQHRRIFRLDRGSHADMKQLRTRWPAVEVRFARTAAFRPRGIMACARRTAATTTCSGLPRTHGSAARSAARWKSPKQHLATGAGAVFAS